MLSGGISSQDSVNHYRQETFAFSWENNIIKIVSLFLVI